ncbi:hypothetical protein ACMAUO_00385 [Gluconacetobacter sp. Hr-1-5]|uniref:hypothetical protein n=1 Tax=Gluconacetobacter sp. Hr-1-5 TaxID=3395370 RepID=UPI003B526611
MSHAMHDVNDLSCSEKLAIWMIRCVTRREVPACTGASARPVASGLFMAGFRSELEGVVEAFRAAMSRMAGLRMERLDVGMPGTVILTTTEQGFLDATSAAQNGNEAAVRSALRRIFPHHYVQSRFAAAVTVLAACLAGAGHWLPSRRPSPGVQPPRLIDMQTGEADAPRPQDADTAALVAMARWQELDMGMSHHHWPHPENLGLVH